MLSLRARVEKIFNGGYKAYMKQGIVIVMLAALFLAGCSGKADNDSVKAENTKDALQTDSVAATEQKEPTGTVIEINEEELVGLPGYSEELKIETLPVTALTVDAEHDEYNIMNIGRYKSTGNTKLAITDIKVFGSSNPGVENLGAYESGETLIVNLWCNADAISDAKLYIVPEVAKHKESYTPVECLYTMDMSAALISGIDQLFFEIELPEEISPGNYDFRFVCGEEEGYITFHLGG